MKFLALLLLLAAVLTAAPLPLVPLPVNLEPVPGEDFALSESTGIRFSKELSGEAELLADALAKRLGTKPRTVREELRLALPSEIHVRVNPGLEVAKEGYTFEATAKRIAISGKDAAGAWYGMQTLLQLLPPAGDAAWKTGAGATVPALRIEDHPRFGWRGMHLDVGRHLYPVEDIKEFLDWMAFHKLNTFHWHLTEDQGWRIEIKKYPKLTEVGAWRASTPPYGNRNGSDGQRYGGFYTQEQVRDIVAYAAARHITVVPEIEMPGHAAAAIAAYPQFGNNDVPGFAPEVLTHWGVHPYTYSPTEETFAFLDDILTEVCELFPSRYIHIGGDEAPKTQWHNSPTAQAVMKREGLKNEHELQSYFIRRTEGILEEKGRRLIGWDEIREGGLSPKATVMSWRGVQGGIDTAKEGKDVIMAPNSHTYFDHYQEPAAGELAKGAEYECIGGFLPISKVYSFDPVLPGTLTPKEAKHVLGVQAQLWSEYFKTWDKVTYMAFPRVAALAEVAWTPVARKDYADFRTRLDGILTHYDAAGIKRGEPFDPPKRETIDGSTTRTSLGIYQDHWPELAYDGRQDTYFWADRALRKGDTFEVHFAKPTSRSARCTVATGGPASRNGDQLENGSLECTTDGTAWQLVSEVKDGTARGQLPTGTKAIRLRVTQPQTNWLIIHEITVE